MKFVKSLNNNVVLAHDEIGEEVVIFGNGVGFGKKEGDIIEESETKKIFHFKNTSELYNLLNSIPLEVIEMTQEIIEEGQAKLDSKLAETILIALADHLNFAIERYKEDVFIQSPLHWEIRHLYPKEFEIGLISLEIINNKSGLSLPTSEASFIALHFVNAQYELNETQETNTVNHVVSKIVEILNASIETPIDKTSVDYARFITHLRYFIMRYQSDKAYDIKDSNFLYDTLKDRYEDSFSCALQIKGFLLTDYKWDLNKDELVCLMIHIERLRSNVKVST